MGERRLLGHPVGQAVIDLVGDEPDPVALADIGDLGQPTRLQHGARRVGRAGDDDAGDGLAPDGRVDLACGRHPTPCGIGGKGNGRLAERGQDMPVAGIAGRRQGDPGPLIEQRQEGQHEAGRGPRRHHHPLRCDGDAVALAVVPGDALAERRQPQGHRIAQRLAVERPFHGVERRARGGRAGLAHLHMDDLVPLGLARRSGLHHIHDDEGRHRAALGGPHGQRRPGIVQASLRCRHGQTPVAASPQTAMVPP